MRVWIIAVLAVLLVACATSPTGRRQLLLFSGAEMDAMGATAFDEMKKETPVHTDGKLNQYVTCVADAITRVLPREEAGAWEVVVFQDESANAFALPGGKIGVHTGILKVAKTPAQLAAVIGHEVGHVLAQHSAERLSVQFVSDSSQQLIGAMVGGDARGQTVMALLGLGTQVGVLLPYNRTQESEADEIGIKLMAQAGFDPQESITLWHNMSAAAGGQQPPEFMSTHPSHQTRISGLQELAPKMKPLYQQAQAQGRRPACKA